MYSNAQILAAVLNKWAQPVISQLAIGRLDSIPGIQAINNKIRSTGWVSPNWSMIAELSPIIEPVTNRVAQPILGSYFKRLPDEAIPEIAHGVVDAALQQGQLSIMEGRVTFDKSDLEELKKLLDYNLPLKKDSEYVVKTQAETENAETQAA